MGRTKNPDVANTKTEIVKDKIDEVTAVEDIGTTATKEPKEIVVDETAEILKALKQQIDDLKKELDVEKNKTITIVNSNDTKTLDLNRMVKVTSLLNYTYNLNTQPRGKGGVTYTFHKYGETQPIRMKDMLDIVALYSSQFEQCFAILETKKDYDDLGIGYIYDDLLTKEKVSKIIDTCTNEYVDVILSMSEELQSSILSQIAEKICNGKNYDFNAIETLREKTQLQEHINGFKEKELE